MGFSNWYFVIDLWLARAPGLVINQMVEGAISLTSVWKPSSGLTLECSRVGIISKPLFELINKRIHGEGKFKCHLCDYKAHTKFSLQQHIPTHNSEKPFKCDHCDFAGYTQARLDSHMKSIHLPKAFKCDLCDYATTSNPNLKAHIMQYHTMERPFKCDQCDYAGTTSGLLSAHKDRFQTDSTSPVIVMGQFLSSFW